MSFFSEDHSKMFLYIRKSKSDQSSDISCPVASVIDFLGA
jgi:hypothetical protein